MKRLLLFTVAAASTTVATGLVLSGFLAFTPGVVAFGSALLGTAASAVVAYKLARREDDKSFLRRFLFGSAVGAVAGLTRVGAVAAFYAFMLVNRFI